MYNDYFGFTEAPFSLTPDPRFSYTNALYQEAFATLRYGIEARKGFIVITGEAGTGKTTLLRRLMQSFGRHVQTAYIYNPHVTLTELLRLILSDLGLTNRTEDRLAMIAQLNEYLIKQLKQRNIVTLLVDEAQELSIEMLEEIRLLSNLETDTQKLLQIVLMGQPELERKLDQPELRQLKQRVALRCRLDPLPSSEVGEYILARLKAVGYSRKDLFHASAIEKIAAHSRGIPRIINIICDNALLIAFAASKKTVSAATIDEVARDLRLNQQAAPREIAPLPTVGSPEGPIEKLEGFRSKRKSARPGFRTPASPESEFFTIGLEEKPAHLRTEKKLRGYGTGVFSLGIVLGLAAMLFYSQQMWGGLAALTETFKGFDATQTSNAVPAQPAAPRDRSTPDLWQEKSAPEAASPELPAIEQQMLTESPSPNIPEQPQAQSFEPSAPVQQRRSSTASQKPRDAPPPMPERRAAPSPTPSPAALPRNQMVVTDHELEMQVEKAIDNRALRGIGVSVKDGTVYLRGRVPTTRQRLAAQRAAQSVEGVKSIENQIGLDAGPD
jgi:type II secretory pathway predicted ATPase ExeA